MAWRPEIIAMVFDFDDTLVPDSTSSLLQHHGIDAADFWKNHARPLIAQGYDPSLAYLRLILDRVGEGKPLGPLTRTDLRTFGASLDAQYFPGLPAMFDDLKAAVKEARDVSIEFYIVSGGLEDVISGSKVVQNYFRHVYGCRLVGDSEDGPLKHVQRCVTFTEKTRHLFEISKGIDWNDALANPYLVNRDVPQEDRRIPFSNMIYVGDGLTDIPCFSLLKNLGGIPFGVFRPAEEKSAKQVLQELLKPDRVVSAHSPRYGDKDDLGAILRTAVRQMASKIMVRREQAGT